MSPYHDALHRCSNRYWEMVGQAKLDDPALKSFILEFQRGCIHNSPVPKLCRWLGYIQGVLIERGLTTVQAERDWTRPLFRPLDFPEPTPTPITRQDLYKILKRVADQARDENVFYVHETLDEIFKLFGR